MKKFTFVMGILLVMALAACGNDGESNQDAELPELLEVELNLPEENLEVGSDLALEAYVSQGGEAVEDANEVKFEVLKKGDTESEMLEAEHQGKGIYTVNKKFEAEGVYSVTAHVTARNMHNMPRKELVVGNPVEPEADTHEEHEEGANSDAHAHGHGHDHGEPAVLVKLESGFDMVANESTDLSVLITEKDEPLTEATIRFEIWKEGQEKHEFIDATEAGDGVYQASKTFESAGNHLINVHINKGELHEHQLFSVTVK